MTQERVEGPEEKRKGGSKKVCVRCPLISQYGYYNDGSKPKCSDVGMNICNKIFGSTHPDPGLSTSGFTPDGKRAIIKSEPGKRRSG